MRIVTLLVSAVLVATACGGPTFHRRSLLILPQARFERETADQAVARTLGDRGFRVVQPFRVRGNDEELVAVRDGEWPARITITRRHHYVGNARSEGRRAGTYRIWRTGPGVQFGVSAVSLGPDGGERRPTDDVIQTVREVIETLQGPGTPDPDDIEPFGWYADGFAQDVVVTSSGRHPQEVERVLMELERLGYTSVRLFPFNAVHAWRPAGDDLVQLYVTPLDGSVNGTRYEVGVSRGNPEGAARLTARDRMDVPAIIAALRDEARETAPPAH